MKLWKKIFLAAFFPVLVFLNGGIFSVFQMAYASGLEEEKNRATGENEMIVRTLTEEFSAFGDEDAPGAKVLRSIMKEYTAMYRKNNLGFELWQNGEHVYGENGEKTDALSPNTITVTKQDGIETIFLVSDFTVRENTYRLITIRPLTELSSIWNKLKRIFLVISGIMSLVLAVTLYVIVRRMTLPLRHLSHLTREVAEGNYAVIDIRGNDEIAQLGRDFNAMTDAVRERIESQQWFIANLAHEMRTPLTAIGGYSEYLLRGKPDEERQHRALDYMMQESRRMQQMSQHLLQLAMFQGKAFEMEPVSIQSACREAYESCVPILEKKQMEVMFDGEDFSVSGVRDLLVCLFRNLLENAVRACDEKGRVWFETGMQTVRVRDNGAGMKQEELEKIIEPFYRVDKARSRSQGGTGLGLALCSEIVKLHGARMHYASEEGKGTEVTVFFTNP